MASTNEAVAALLREYAELLAITGGDPFRARNYEKAARAVAGYPEDIGRMPAAALTTIPGVGKSIAAKIIEYQRTNTIAAVDQLRTRIPPGVRDLTRVPGLGPKRALALSTELGVATIADLQAALDEGKLRDLPGFGAKSEERIQRGLAVMTHGRVLLNVAMNTAAEIIAALENHSEPGHVRRLAAPHAGDGRRRRHPRDRRH